MSTTLYFRDFFSPFNKAFNAAVAACNLRSLSLQRGNAAVTKATNTVAGTTAGYRITDGAGGSDLMFAFGPIDKITTSASNGTMNFRLVESATQANATMFFNRLTAWNPAGASVGGPSNLHGQLGNVNAEAGTTEGAISATLNQNTSATVPAGYYLVAEIMADDGVGVTMGSGRTVSFVYDGPTAAASGDSFVTLPENFVLLGMGPTASPFHDPVLFYREEYEKRNWLWRPRIPKFWKPDLWFPGGEHGYSWA